MGITLNQRKCMRINFTIVSYPSLSATKARTSLKFSGVLFFALYRSSQQPSGGDGVADYEKSPGRLYGLRPGMGQWLLFRGEGQLNYC